MAMSSSYYHVSHQGGQFDVVPAAAQAIFGDYFESSNNHGRKVYKRKGTSSQRGLPEAMLFFWDSPENKELSGWWFGDKLGGGQVWARNKNEDLTPPRGGWRCPVDGPPNKNLVIERRALAGRQLNDKQEAARPVPPWAKKARVAESESKTLVLASKLGSEAPQTTGQLLGEYVQHGVNHGKPTYLMRTSSGIEVWLYYWDRRDGAESSGWWFGESVGGEEVYGWAQLHTPAPPKWGWKIPHNKGVKNDVALVIKGREEEVEMGESDRLLRARELVENLESQIETAISTSKSVMDGEGSSFEEGVRAVAELLQSKVQALEEASASLQRHGQAARTQKASKTFEADLSLLSERLLTAIGKVRSELGRSTERLQALEREDDEERDAKAVEGSLTPLVDLVAQAHMAAEAAGSEMDAGKAWAILKDAKAKVEAALDQARGFAPVAQKLALKEFGSLQDKCEAMEKRLSLWDEVTERAGKVRGSSPGTAGGDDGTKERELSEQIREVESETRRLLDVARVALRGEGTDEQEARSCLEMLKEHQTAVMALQRSVSVGGASTFVPRLEAVRKALQNAIGPAQTRIAGTQASESSMPAAIEAVALAEEAVHAVALDAGDLELRRKQMETAVQYGEDGGEIKQAMDETQVSAERAQRAISAARRQLDAQIKAARMLPEGLQHAAFSDVAPVRKRLIEAQKALNPYKRVRTEYEQHVKAKDDLGHLTKRVASAEAELEKAEAVLSATTSTEEDLKGIEASLAPTQDALANVVQLLEKRVQTSIGGEGQGTLRDQAETIQKRAAKTSARLTELLGKTGEKRLTFRGSTFTLQARQQVQKAEALLQRLAEAEKPWKEAVGELLPEAQAEDAFSACAVILDEAVPVVEAAKEFVQEGLIGAKQLPEGLVRLETTSELQRLEARMDTVTLKMTQVKVETFARKTRMQMADVVQAVVKAEAALQVTAKAASPLEEDNLLTVQVKQLKYIQKQVMATEAASAKACKDARALVTAKKRDVRFKESPSFNTQLTKFDRRLEHAESELAAKKQAAEEAEGNIKTYKKFKADLDQLDKSVGEAEVLALPLGDERPTKESEETTARSLLRVQDSVNTWKTAAEVLGKHPQGAMRLAMGRLLVECAALQKRLVEAKNLNREGFERAFCRIFVSEAATKMKNLEEAMVSADMAEGPFLTGIEVIDPQVSSKALEECDGAAAKAQIVLGEVLSYLNSKMQEVGQFKCEDEASQVSVDELLEFLTRAKTLSTKLAQFRSDTARRKKLA